VFSPTEADCRDFLVSDVEPLFECSPALQGSSRADHGRAIGAQHAPAPDLSGRPLKVVAGRRRASAAAHRTRAMIDEIDAVAITAEGDPVPLASGAPCRRQRRSSSARRRSKTLRIACGARLRAVGHAHVRGALPACGAFAEITWRRSSGPRAGPRMPHIFANIAARRITKLTSPKWSRRALARFRDGPVSGHAGFKINAL